MKVNRRQFTNLLLFLGVIAMAFVAWLDYRARNAEPRPLLALPAEQINQLRIERPGRPSLLLRRERADWWLAEPFRAPLDANRVAILLTVGEEIPASRYARLGRDLREFGLQPPLARLTLNDTLTLAFGEVEISSRRRYLLHDDEVMLLDDRHYPLLDAGLHALADLRPLGDSLAAAIRLPDQPRSEDAQLLSNWQQVRAAGVEPAGDGEARTLQVELVGGGHLNMALRSHPAGFALQPEGAGYQLIIGRSLAAPLGLE